MSAIFSSITAVLPVANLSMINRGYVCDHNLHHGAHNGEVSINSGSMTKSEIYMEAMLDEFWDAPLDCLKIPPPVDSTWRAAYRCACDSNVFTG